MKKTAYLIGGEVFSFNGGLAAIAGLLVIGDFATTKLRVLFCIDHPRSHFVFHYLRRAEERCPPQAIASSSRRQKRAVTLFYVPLRTARWSNRPRYDVRRVPLAMCAISIEGVSHENAHAQN